MLVGHSSISEIENIIVEINGMLEVGAYKYNISDTDNKTYLDILLYGDNAEVDIMVEHVSNEIGYTTEKARRNIRTILLNLFNVYICDPMNWIQYPRMASKYTIPKRYNPNGISYTVFIKAFNRLEEHGFINNIPGHYDKKTRKGIESRMMASDKLIDVYERFNIRPTMFKPHPFREYIILRDEKQVNKKYDEELGKYVFPKITGKDIDYEDSAEIIKMRHKLKEYNESIMSVDIRFDDEILDKFPELKDVDFKKRVLRRIFNESFDLGGRYYSAFWLILKNRKTDARRHILINGQSTVELDYDGYHINMLYHLEGLNLDGHDPYLLSGYDTDEKTRNLIKLFTLISVNSRSFKGAAGALEAEIEEEPDRYPSEIPALRVLYSAIKNKHKPVAKYICSGKGIYLQNIDSWITEYILDKMTTLRKPVLPVHDSYICMKQDEGFLRELMKEAYLTCFPNSFAGLIPPGISRK